MQSEPAPPAFAQDPSLTALTDQCVMCGLCLPHCPSYRVARDEGESPRGRIAYAKALATDAMTATARMRANLDTCLACGSCEAVCPSDVRYGEIIVATRALIDAPRDQTHARRWLRALAQQPGFWRVLQRLAPVFVSLRLHRLAAGIFPRLRPALEQLPALPRAVRRPPRFSAARGARRGAVALFRGCAAAALDADTHAAAVEVLTRLGFDVHAPDTPQCCGALARHAGDTKTSGRLEGAVAGAFRELRVDAVIGTASGCQESLARGLVGASVVAWDLMQFLAQDPVFARLAPKPARRRAALMIPCTQRGGASLQSVLARIPDLELSTLPLQPRCCGAAGVYFIDHPEIAEPLRAERVAQLADLAPDVILTTNMGCRLYLQSGLHARGLDLPVRHPISLIAELMP